MKRLATSFLLLSSLLFTVQSNEPISALNSHPLKDCIEATFKHVLGIWGEDQNIPNDALIEVPKHNENEYTYGTIELYIPGLDRKGHSLHCKINLTYLHGKYEQLDKYKQKLFDQFNFNKDKYVTVIGIYDGRTMQPGSITVNKETKLLKWVLMSIPGLLPTSSSTYKIETCPSVRYKQSKGIYIQ